MNIPLVDLKAQYIPLKTEILSRIEEILDSMQLFLGPNVKKLEQEFAAYCDVKHAVGVSEGTTALQLALMACGIEPGDEVITVSHTFIATAEAIVLAGAKPIFIDIDPETFCIDVDQIEKAITSRTRAIIPVHLYGMPADMDSIMDLAKKFNLWVIEDACQAHGARYKGARTGGLGHVAAYSFYFSKNLGAYGEGGILTTNDDELARKVRILRDHGSPQRYHHEMIGLNGRLDEIQAAVLRIKLPYLDTWNFQRRTGAAHYTELLAGIDSVMTPHLVEEVEHVYHLYVIRVKNRNELLKHLREQGIGAGIHYPVPCHLQPAFQSLGYQEGDFPITEQVAKEIISLPMYAELTPSQREYIVKKIHEFYKEVVSIF